VKDERNWEKEFGCLMKVMSKVFLLLDERTGVRIGDMGRSDLSFPYSVNSVGRIRFEVERILQDGGKWTLNKLCYMNKHNVTIDFDSVNEQ
jgi:hypothetical protein